jgi:hypothetical protein
MAHCVPSEQAEQGSAYAKEKNFFSSPFNISNFLELNTEVGM